MAKKSKRIRRRPKKSNQPTQKKQETPASTTALPKISWLGRHVGTVLTALGLAVGLIALIELSPRLSASPNSLGDVKAPLRWSFSVSNDGYLQITDISAGCFMWKVQGTPPSGGSVSVTNALYDIIQPPRLLIPADRFSLPCAPQLVGSGQPDKPVKFSVLDIAIVTYYRPWPFVFLMRRRFFRFVGHYDDEFLVWEPQPADSKLVKDFDDNIEKMRRQSEQRGRKMAFPPI
jgi:hypothetical protein